MIWLPTLRQVILLHEKTVARSGGSQGVRDAVLIESALMRASAGFADAEAYPTIAQKAAAVCCGLIGNHGFVDGNKRIGIRVMLLILRKNGVSISFTQQELIRLGLDAAKGLLSVGDVATWIESHKDSPRR